MKAICRKRFWALTLALGWIFIGTASDAAGPRVLPEGKLPDDARLQPLKDLDGYFPFILPASESEWTKRAEQLRRRVLVSQGLWPMPAKTPLNPVIHGLIDQGDYTIEKAYFESAPGFYVTGSLYRPKDNKEKHPAVLCPHGHWSNGRFHDAGVDAVRQQIVQGAERFENGGRSPLQARCMQLARMGCVVFHYDMIGYADCTQLSFDLVHRFGKPRPEMNGPENWGFYSPQAESYCQSVMGLQTYNSVRALDFITGLPDVDASRIAVTGASGGGTQTFMIAAIDPRVTIAIPAVMVSTAMQGGCTCENSSLLRIGTGNVELAALFAPKPQCILAANDWTKEMATKGFPELQKHYASMGAAKNVELHALIHFGHNYNYVSRAAMYQFVNKHFGLNLPSPVIENDYPRLDAAQMTVWDEQHPKPAGGDDFERGLVRYLTDDARKELATLAPKDAESLKKYKEIVGGGIDIAIGRGLPEATDIEFEQKDKTDRGSYLEITGLLRNKKHHEELPMAFLHPEQWQGKVVIWLDAKGKAGLFDDAGAVRPEVQKLIDAGASVVGADLFFQGEFLADGQPVTKTRKVANPREAAAFSFGYNDTLFAQRTQDVLTVIAFVINHEYKPQDICLVGLNGSGPWAAAARAQARDAVDKAAIDTAGFRFLQVPDIYHPDLLPGGAKYDDLPGMLAVAAPDAVWIAGEKAADIAATTAAYQAADAAKNLTLFDGPADAEAKAAVDWILAK